jgi:hypothetical protein
VMAEPSHRHASAASSARVYGSVTRARPHGGVSREPVSASQIDIHDCSINSVFTQCGFAH